MNSCRWTITCSFVNHYTRKKITIDILLNAFHVNLPKKWMVIKLPLQRRRWTIGVPLACASASLFRGKCRSVMSLGMVIDLEVCVGLWQKVGHQSRHFMLHLLHWHLVKVQVTVFPPDTICPDYSDTSGGKKERKRVTISCFIDLFYIWFKQDSPKRRSRRNSRPMLAEVILPWPQRKIKIALFLFTSRSFLANNL